MNTFHNLNAQLNLPQDGVINLKSDKEAARAYFIEYVNTHTRYFHSLEEKTGYMVENELWSKETVEMFSFEDFKQLFKVAYDYKFRFQSLLGAQKFYSTYALKDMDGETILERFEDRVVMTAIHLSGGDLAQAEDLIRIIITGRFQPATPTFLNAGRAKGGEMVSCFLLRMEDSLESIARVYASGMQLSKRGGGVGILLTNMRESGAPLKGVPGVGRGIVPIMKNLEDQFSHIDQLGMRQGAGAVYLNAHHPDIMQFLDTKRENADEKIRIKTLSLGVVIPDITFHLAKDNKDMYLFSPYDVERVEGKPMSECSVTENYHKWVEDERITKKKVSARRFFQTLSEIQFESGYPYAIFEDTANKFHAMKHAGRINLSNLCVAPETRVLTDKGYKHIGELDGQTVNAWNGKEYSPSLVAKTGEGQKLITIKFSNGAELDVTPYHKFYIQNEYGAKEKEVRAAELVEGDKLAKYNFGVVEGEGELPHAYTAGLFTADGTYGSGKPRITLYGEKKKLVPYLNIKSGSGKEDSLGRLNYGLFEDIPPKFFVPTEYSVKSRLEWLAGLIDGDGTGNGAIGVQIGSIHPEFLNEVRILLSTLGVHSKVAFGGKASSRQFRPDQNFYECSDTYRLIISGVEVQKLMKLGIETRRVELEPYEHQRAAMQFIKVISVEDRGRVDDTYCLNEPKRHRVVFEGIETGNCSEIAQLNTPSEMNEDLTYTHVGDDISCNLGSLNVQKMLELDRDEFIGTVRVAVRALDQVSRLTDIDAVPTVKQGNRKSRAIGLGQMNLHGALAHNMLEYGSEEALTLWDNYMALVTYAAMQESVELAKQYGTHAYWDGCEYQTGEWFRRTSDTWLEKNNYEAPVILGDLHAPNVEEWNELEDEVRRNGMANAYLQTIPPTGSISYINNSTSSIHPIASKIEIRKEGKIGRVYYPAPHMRTENLHLYKDAYEIGYEKLIDTYAVSQHWIDQSQSCTLFFQADATTRDLDRSRIYAWRKGLKSIYYIRLRQLGLEGTRVGEDVDECVACQL